MPLSWWSDLTSLVFTFYASGVLMSAKRTDFLSTEDWGPTVIAIATILLTVLHFAVHTQV